MNTPFSLTDLAGMCVVVWAGMTVADFIFEAGHDRNWRQACDASYWQGTALATLLLVAWLVRR